LLGPDEDAAHSGPRQQLRPVVLHPGWSAPAPGLVFPQYTLWETETPRAAIMAALHCTAGDIVIALCALALAVILLGEASWPVRTARRVAVGTMLLGVIYTVFSEWLNTEVRGTWSYSTLMPLVPPLGTGLSPLLQWLVVPVLALGWAHRGNART